MSLLIDSLAWLGRKRFAVIAMAAVFAVASTMAIAHQVDDHDHADDCSVCHALECDDAAMPIALGGGAAPKAAVSRSRAGLERTAPGAPHAYDGRAPPRT